MLFNFSKYLESKITSNTYNKYMVEMHLNTCRNKAHFFAQVAIETDYKLDIPDGEGFNYYWEKLITTFSAFNTTQGKQKAKDWGRQIESRQDPNCVDVPQETQIKIANYAYSPPALMAKDLGNTEPNDGWTYRGQGIIQLTGKAAYIYANRYTQEEGFDIVNNPDIVSKNLMIGVLTAMAFWKWKKIYNIANDKSKKVNRDVCEFVGKNVVKKAKDGSNSTNYIEKQKAFDQETSKLFRIDECQYGEIPNLDESEVITYHIFASNKTIVKQIPKEGKNKHPEFRKYIYHDKNGGKHTVGDFSMITVKKINTTSETLVDSEGKVELIHFSKETFKGYESPDGKVKCKVAVWEVSDYGANGGKREYINPECLAGLLGAMSDYNIDFLTFRGSSNNQGKPYPSVSHVNGLKTDIAYFKKNGELGQVLLGEEKLDLDLNVNFINALVDYGYKTKGKFCTEMFTPYGQTKKRFLVDGMKHVENPRHNNHLHIGGFQFNTVKIKQDE